MLFAFFLSLLLSYVIMHASIRVGALDMPDFRRKVNTVPIPRLGGVAFFIAFFCAVAVKNVIFRAAPSTLELAVVSAGGLSLLFGAADDIFSLPATLKLILQAVTSAIAAMLLGISEPVYYATAVIFCVFLMNAFNLADGLDGLCGGISLSSLLFLALADIVLFNTGGGLIAILLFFATLGFIPLNAHPAKLYMGDSGAQTLGLSIAVLSLDISRNAPLLPLFFFALPILDTVCSALRRIIAGRSPFSSDRGHFHHRLLDLGLSHAASVNLLLILSVLVSVTALFLHCIFALRR